MAIIIDVPTAGKVGLSVYYPGRTGLVRRQWVTPANPNSTAQELVRQNLTAMAKTYDTLTDAQQDAWIAAAANQQTRSVLGQSGPLTGLQLFVKVNCALLAIGGDTVLTPPAVPSFEVLPVSGLEATNTGGVIALNVLTTGSPPDGTMLWGCAPQPSGVRRAVSPRFLGTLGSPVSGKVNITSVYTARFGAPVAGQRVYVQLNANIDGYEGPKLTFGVRMPAAT